MSTNDRLAAILRLMSLRSQFNVSSGEQLQQRVETLESRMAGIRREIEEIGVAHEAMLEIERDMKRDGIDVEDLIASIMTTLEDALERSGARSDAGPRRSAPIAPAPERASPRPPGVLPLPPSEAQRDVEPRTAHRLPPPGFFASPAPTHAFAPPGEESAGDDEIEDGDSEREEFADHPDDRRDERRDPDEDDDFGPRPIKTDTTTLADVDHYVTMMGVVPGPVDRTPERAEERQAPPTAPGPAATPLFFASSTDDYDLTAFSARSGAR